MNDKSSAEAPAARAWWSYPHVWLLIAGPAAVVVAGVITAVIAVRGADTVVNDRTFTPAVQGRNHAATPQAPRR